MTTPVPPPPPINLPPPQKGSGLGWFLAVSGAVLLVLTLGCMSMFVGDLGGGVADTIMTILVFGAPTLIIGGLLLWLGIRRLKR